MKKIEKLNIGEVSVPEEYGDKINELIDYINSHDKMHNELYEIAGRNLDLQLANPPKKECEPIKGNCCLNVGLDEGGGIVKCQPKKRRKPRVEVYWTGIDTDEYYVKVKYFRTKKEAENIKSKIQKLLKGE